MTAFAPLAILARTVNWTFLNVLQIHVNMVEPVKNITTTMSANVHQDILVRIDFIIFLMLTYFDSFVLCFL